jgi:hypothetical protein
MRPRPKKRLSVSERITLAWHSLKMKWLYNGYANDPEMRAMLNAELKRECDEHQENV